MTENVLEVAIKLKKRIDQLKKASEEVVEVKELCYGSAEDVNERDYFIKIFEKGYTVAYIPITPTAAYEALERQERIVNGELGELADKFQELH